jgi:hypothetical protein
MRDYRYDHVHLRSPTRTRQPGSSRRCSAPKSREGSIRPARSSRYNGVVFRSLVDRTAIAEQPVGIVYA